MAEFRAEPNHYVYIVEQDKVKDTYAWDNLSKEELRSLQDSYSMLCPGCGATMFLRKYESHVYCYARHTSTDCKYANGAKHITTKIGDVVYHIDAILHHRDKEESEEDEKVGKPSAANTEDAEDEVLDTVAFFTEDVRYTSSIRNLKDGILHSNPDELINGNIKVDDLVVWKRNILEKKRNGIEGICLAFLKRYMVKRGTPLYNAILPCTRKGYILLVDDSWVVGDEDNDHIFFLVKNPCHSAMDRHWNDIKDKSPRKHFIVVLSKWTRVDAPEGLDIYKGLINSRSILFYGYEKHSAF